MTVSQISTGKKLVQAVFVLTATAALICPAAVNAQVMVEPSAVAQHQAVAADEHKNQVAQTGDYARKQEQVEVKASSTGAKTSAAQKNEKPEGKKSKAANKLVGFFSGMFSSGSDDAHSMDGPCFTSP